MLIQCTKKMLNKIGVAPLEVSAENPLFCWHANLIKIERRNVVVLVNNLNKYVLVLWGIYAKDFKQLGVKIKDVIRDTFKAEGINDDIIGDYLTAAGDVQFTKTAGPGHVAGLNHICKELSWLSDRYIDMEGAVIGKNCSSRMTKVNGVYEYPSELMIIDLRKTFGRPAISCAAAKLKISLELDDVAGVSRTVVIPLKKTLGEFHKILQVLFSWQDYHLHEFIIYDDKKVKYPLDAIPYESHKDGWGIRQVIAMNEDNLEYKEGVPAIVEKGHKLNEYLPGRMKYTYDFGDYWEHYIETLEIIEDYDKNTATLIEWEGDSLPEDVGGPYGYKHLLEVLLDKDHEEHESLKGWARMQRYRRYDPIAVGWSLNDI